MESQPIAASGAGTAQSNGRYYLTDTTGTSRTYRQEGGSMLIEYSPEESCWYIKSGVDLEADPFYVCGNPSPTPPFTGWKAWSGEEPAPSLSLAASEPPAAAEATGPGSPAAELAMAEERCDAAVAQLRAAESDLAIAVAMQQRQGTAAPIDYSVLEAAVAEARASGVDSASLALAERKLGAGRLVSAPTVPAAGAPAAQPAAAGPGAKLRELLTPTRTASGGRGLNTQVDLTALGGAIAEARRAGEDVTAAEQTLGEVKKRRQQAAGDLRSGMEWGISESVRQLPALIEAAELAGVEDRALIKKAHIKLRLARRMQPELLHLLEELELARPGSTLIPELDKRGVTTCAELAKLSVFELQAQLTVRKGVPVDQQTAQRLHEAVALEAQLLLHSSGSSTRSHAACIVGFDESAAMREPGHPHYLVRSTVVAADGGRLRSSVSFRFGAFKELHTKIQSTLQLPVAFPLQVVYIAPSPPLHRLCSHLHTHPPQSSIMPKSTKDKQHRVVVLERYLGEALAKCAGTQLPPPLAEFLGLPRETQETAWQQQGRTLRSQESSLTARIAALDEELPKLQQALGAVPGQKKKAAEMEEYSEAGRLKSQEASLKADVAEKERERAELMTKRAQATAAANDWRAQQEQRVRDRKRRVEAATLELLRHVHTDIEHVDDDALHRAIEGAVRVGVDDGRVQAGRHKLADIREAREAAAAKLKQSLDACPAEMRLEEMGAVIDGWCSVCACGACDNCKCNVPAAKERLQKETARRENLARVNREQRANPKSELHERMLRCADEIGGLRNDACGPNRFLGEPTELKFGHANDMVLGIEHVMCVEDDDGFKKECYRGEEAMKREIEKYGSDEAKECLRYVLEMAAGSSDKAFQNGQKRDCDADGDVLAERRRADGRGMRLDDFVEHPKSRQCHLKRVHVLGLRLYTSAAFKDINGPLRDIGRFERSEAHPLPVTVTYIREALGKLRVSMSEENCEYAHVACDFYRGIKSVMIPDEFLKKGGTELAPMSTTYDLKVAMQYSASANAVLLRLRTKNYLTRGPDISYVSCFPKEEEYLFPPLTYLRPMGHTEMLEVDEAVYHVVDVEPQF